MQRIFALAPFSAVLLFLSCGSISDPYAKKTYAYGTPEDSLAASSDLVIDGCKITFKGQPIPLGGTAQDHIKVFGIPTDTVSVEDGEHCVYWGNIGFRACSPTVFWNTPGWESATHLAFHYTLRSSNFPKMKGTSTFGIRPFGRFSTDRDLNQEIVSNAFRKTDDYVPGGRSETTMDLDPHPKLHVKLAQNGWDDLIEMRTSQTTMTKTPTYAEVFGSIPASCKAK